MFPRLRKLFGLSRDDAPIATKTKTEAELRAEIKTLDATIAREAVREPVTRVVRSEGVSCN
jgi:hypothetical protein